MLISRKQVVLMAALLATSGSAFASKAADAVSQCRNAVVQEQGVESVAKLKKVKSRGAIYEVWMNIKGDDSEMRTYCALKRGKIQQMVTEEGRWTSSHPKRPEIASKPARTASASTIKVN